MRTMMHAHTHSHTNTYLYFPLFNHFYSVAYLGYLLFCYMAFQTTTYVCLFVVVALYTQYFPFSANFHFSLSPSFPCSTPQLNNVCDPMKRIIPNTCKQIAIAIVTETETSNNNTTKTQHNFRKISFHTRLNFGVYIDFDICRNRDFDGN